MIVIKYHERAEMMEIIKSEPNKGDKRIFYGNYWDFKRDPEDLKKFLNKIGIEAIAENTLKSDDIDDDMYDEEDEEEDDEDWNGWTDREYL